MNYLDQLFKLKGKIAIVSGSTGQLGAVICEGLSRSGVVVVGVDLNLDGKRIDNVDYKQLDITNKEMVNEVFSKIIEKYGRLDILINNAGVSTFEPFEQRSEDNFDWVMDVNLKGTFFCMQTMVNLFEKFHLTAGSFINIGSIFGIISPDFRNYTDCNRKNSEVYGATKAGIIQMTKYFAVHLADRNIRVNAVSPGGILNPISPQGEDFQKNYAFRCPLKRMADEKEMIGAILYLASDASTYTTGQNIIVDGGFTCW